MSLGLEALHRLKKDYALGLQGVRKAKKKLGDVKKNGCYEEVKIAEKQLYAQEEDVAALEVKMTRSWD
jgi:hypothetical protein